jgi:hypothetical protein
MPTASPQAISGTSVQFPEQKRRLMFTDLTLTKLKGEGYFWDLHLPAFGVRKGKRRTCFIVVRDGRRKKIGLWKQA